MSRHRYLQPTDGVHSTVAFSYADATARAAATGFLAADVGKIAFQVSDGTFWLLTATTPSWAQYPIGVPITNSVLTSVLSGGEYPIWQFCNAASTADQTSLATSNTVLTVTFDRTGNPADSSHIITGFSTAVHTYLARFGARIAIWQTATPTSAGHIEMLVDAVLVTNSSGVVTSVTLQTTPTPDTSCLPTALSAATAAMAGSASNTMTINATQPSAVTCTARAKVWVNNFELLA